LRAFNIVEGNLTCLKSLAFKSKRNGGLRH
jgi:hypothetical protein